MYCYAIILVTFILAVVLNLIFSREPNSHNTNVEAENTVKEPVTKAAIAQNENQTDPKKGKENKVRFQVDFIEPSPPSVCKEDCSDTSEMDRWSKIKETLDRDKERRDKAINWFKNKFTKKVDKVEPDDQPSNKHCCACPYNPLHQSKPLKTSGPVNYRVTYQRKVMHWKRFFWSKPVKKKYKTFAHYAAQDRLPQVWHASLMKFSDQHPILYNRTLWTTTTGAQRRLITEKTPLRLNQRGRKKNIRRTYEVVDIEAIFQKDPQYRCFYSIKKETILQLNPPSRAQWRR